LGARREGRELGGKESSFSSAGRGGGAKKATSQKWKGEEKEIVNIAKLTVKVRSQQRKLGGEKPEQK